MEKLERKRYQNKVSQRKHRARQATRIAEMEMEILELRKQLQLQKGKRANILQFENKKIKDKLTDALKLVTTVQEALRGILNDSGMAHTEELTNTLQNKLAESGLTQAGDLKDHGHSHNNNINDSGLNHFEKLSNNSQHALGKSDLTNGDVLPVYEQVASPLPDYEESISEIKLQGPRKSITQDLSVSKFGSPATTESTRDFWSAFCYPVQTLTFGQHTIRQQFVDIENNFLRLLAKLNLDISLPDSILDPRLLNLVTICAEKYLEVVPRLRNFTLALGSTKWVCGELLLSCFHRTNCEYLETLLCNSNMSGTIDPNSGILKEKLMLGLEERIKTGPFEQAIDCLFSSDARAMVLPENPANVVMPSYFRPTEQQLSCIHGNILYDQFFNFIIWPELRDSLLEHRLNLRQWEIIGIIEELMDNVVLKVGRRVFFLCELLSVVSATNQKPAITFPQLVRYGVTHPSNWKLSKSYGDKYADVVPRSIVCEIDDSEESNVIRAFGRRSVVI